MKTVHPIALYILSLITVVTTSLGTVVEFTLRPVWEAAAGEFTTIAFTGFASGTIITDQYQNQGVLFTDKNDIAVSGPEFYLEDGWGLRGGQSIFDADINLQFASPQFNIGVDYPGGLRIELYRNGDLIFTSSQFGGVGVGFFAGLISSEPFDAAVLLDWSDDNVAIDDLHFGVPTPGAMSLLALAALCPRHGRRR